jgi:hypothetical protein
MLVCIFQHHGAFGIHFLDFKRKADIVYLEILDAI